MLPAARLYSTLVLFGKETGVSVASPETFAELTDAVVGLLGLACPEVKARGRIIADKGKNVAPRKGRWSPALRDQYLEASARGRFEAVELFDPAWADDREPDAYGSIRKHWDYDPHGITERTDVGAENSVTVALRTDFVEDALERLKSAAKSMIPMLDAFYGTIESPVPWDQDIGDGIFEDMIDVRWHNRVNKDYGSGEHRMTDGVPRLYRGNLLSRTQLKGKDAQAMAKLPGVAAVERWPGGLTYLELTEQPKYQSKTPARFADVIRFIPQD